jgi:DNA-binding response OmpR family regulator
VGGAGLKEPSGRQLPRRPSIPLPARLRIAAIDRDAGFTSAVAEHLERIDWTLQLHRSPVNRWALLRGNPDAVLVDIDLLGPRWDEWLANHPAQLPHLGVLVCTARSTSGQRIRGLRAGADGWLTKPCYPEEVCAHLQAIVRGLRRGAFSEELRPLRGGELEVRPDLHDALVLGRRAGLTSREFELLLHLARHAPLPIAREQLYRAVWGFEMARGDRSIDTFVRKIRTKLGPLSPRWSYIQTHKGVGYGFAARRVSGDGATGDAVNGGGA